MAKVGAFRFWCQKVLPLVYDDSISYYELLNKMVVYLNNVISDFNTVAENFDNLDDAFDTLQGSYNDTKNAMLSAYDRLQSYVNNYFDNLDVQKEINNKLDEMAEDGSLTALLQPFIENQISTDVTAWLQAHIKPTSPAVDSSLTVSGAAADAKVTGDKIGDLTADLKQEGIFNLADQLNHYNAEWNGLTFRWENGKCTISGTSTAITYNNLFMSANTLPQDINAGDILRVKFSGQNVWLYVYDYTDENPTILKGSKSDFLVKIPDTCKGLIIRTWVARGTTVNETVYPQVYKNSDCTISAVDTASQSETGKTDMRPIIQDMLDLYGYCKLNVGAFYISSQVNIPEGGTLEGCGESTKIYLMSGNSIKAAIQLRRYGAVRDLSVIGSYTDLTESDFGISPGKRYGIQYYKDSHASWTSAYCSISNVHIRNFTAAGIYQYGTGANVEQGFSVSNVHIKNCWAGIWIYSNSEFCRYSNVQITYCYIACINNGGNNSFNNCVFHAYTVGMKIDGTQNNAAHGMCSNSSFCHTGNNSGSAVTLSDIEHGYIFSACQYWYNSIDIDRCGGIVFNGCEIGRSAPININGGNTVMFGNCVFMNDVSYPPSINITDNTKVKFTGCYGSVSGNEIVA